MFIHLILTFFFFFFFQGGNLELLIWLHSNEVKCPWNVDEVQFVSAKNNHRHVLEWMIKNGEKLDDFACRGASEGKITHKLQYYLLISIDIKKSISYSFHFISFRNIFE